MDISQEVLRIMTWIEIIVKIACILLGIAVSCAITIPKLVKAIKQRRAAKTEAEKAEADLAIRNYMKELIVNAEANYMSLNDALKQIGDTAGTFKKDKVLSDLRDYCDEHGYEFNKAELGQEIDDLVAMTKQVNAISK